MSTIFKIQLKMAVPNITQRWTVSLYTCPYLIALLVSGDVERLNSSLTVTGHTMLLCI